MRVAVIGAGPSGLVTLKYLRTAHESLGIEPIEAQCFEREGEIGGTFFARTYEDAEVRSFHSLSQACVFGTTVTPPLESELGVESSEIRVFM